MKHRVLKVSLSNTIPPADQVSRTVWGKIVVSSTTSYSFICSVASGIPL